jgi:hypothetical protein
MSERMAAQIWIGGKVPARLVDELCGEIDAEGVTLDWGGACFAPKTGAELLNARVDCEGAAVLYLCDEQASWGQFNSLEGFLQEHNIPFTRRNDGGAAYNGEIVEFRAGQDPLCIPTDADGEAVVDVSVLRPIDELLAGALEQLENGSMDKADRADKVASMLKDAHGQLRAQLPPVVAPLEPFEIVTD